MKFIDFTRLEIRSGSGGNGCCSFRREKYIPRGGPDGGDGGKGGDVYVEGNRHRTTLMDFKFTQHFHAGNGQGGMGKDRHGRTGDEVVLRVPVGTVIRDEETGELLMDVVDEEKRLLLKGGLGGRGNARFKTSTNRAPRHFEEGQPGETRWVSLELKLMADVGLVGFPNAGKSTFISRVSSARPKIADYPFTTLVPNLGVVHAGQDEAFVVADIPGIISGAAEGHGLGHQFLRHIERTAVLLLLLDTANFELEPWEEYTVLLKEMEAFSPTLMDKRRLVVLTKMDLQPDPKQMAALAKKLQKAGETVYAISSVSGEGIEELVRRLGEQVKEARQEEGRSLGAGWVAPGEEAAGEAE